MSKGITPIVAVILLLLVTISITGFALIFFQRTTQQASEEVQSQLQQQLSAAGARFEIVGIDKNKVYVKNIGTANLQNLAFYVDGNQISNASPFSITPNTVGEVLLNNSQLAMVPGDKLRVTSVGFAQEQQTKFYDKNTVAYWRFDEADRTTVKDYSGNGNDGTFVGETWNDGDLKPACPNCPTLTTGKYGNALNFDGSDDYVYGGNNPVLFPSSITVALWINLNNLPNGVADITQHVTGGFSKVYMRTTSDNKVSFTVVVSGIGGVSAISDRALNAGQWYHLVGIYDGIAVKLYVNGILQGSPSSASGKIDWALPLNYFQIGGATGGTTTNINGAIDEVRIYNRALSAAEVAEDMNSAYPVGRTMASYSFEKIVGNQVQDTHNIVKGKYGAAMSFDGLNDRIDFGDTINPTTDFAVEFWMKASKKQDNPSGFYDPVSFGHDGTKGWVFQGSAATLTWHAGDGTLESIPIDIDVRDDSWHHFTASISSATGRKLIRDGEANVKTGTKTQIVQLPAQPFMLGTEPSIISRAFNGTIDEVRVLNIPITP